MFKQSIQRLFIGILIYFIGFPTLRSQTEPLVFQIEDPRDQEVYRVIQIGALKWFQDNLKFQTEQSYYPRLSKELSKIEEGNFYTYQELDQVCPPGWRIPNQQEWEQYFHYRLQSQNGDLSAIVVDTLEGEYLAISYTDASAQVGLLAEENPIDLKAIGWIEGKRRKNKGTTTIWVRHSNLEDKRFHMHISDHRYIFHTHQHHIDDVPKKSRMFMVKCVSE